MPKLGNVIAPGGNAPPSSAYQAGALLLSYGADPFRKGGGLVVYFCQ